MTANNGFGVVAQVLDTQHFAVILSWGHRMECPYYGSDTLAVADRVFVERLPLSGQWMISCKI